ncbi:MAG TPA: T9SS type A sorting domain-containing protein, partial [Chitinophagaceae bacterium]|nr:T9SS type A sorting domain-containing protein [Chitinophagaceae bacterium]
KSFRGVARVPLGCPGVGVVNAINIMPSQATLSWAAITGAGGYEYAVTSTPNPPASWSTTTNTTATVSGLTNGAIYYGHVRTSCGASDVSEWTTVRFVAECQPPATSLLTITTGITGATTANWGPVAGANNYEYAITVGAVAPATGTIVNDATVTVNNLNPLTQYYFHVRSNCGSGAFSAWISKPFTTGCFAPLVNIDANNKGAIATWRKVSTATGYEYALTNHAGDPLSGQFTADTFRVFNNQVEGSNQYLHIRTVCANGSYSPWYTVPFQLLGLNAYPNPVDGTLHLRLNGTTQFNGHIIVADITGRIVKKIVVNGSTLDIDTHTWQAGIYLVRYIDKTHSYSVKILKK